jgi:ABC-type lipoprotein export system ATPase subunit
MCNGPLIEVEDIWKSYQLDEVRVDALRGVSLTIERGEFVALVGASGSGKSTLMNTLGCLDRPTSGTYRLAGQDIVKMNRDQRARIRNEQIGFVFQSFNLLNRTSALENVELPLLYRSGLSRSGRRSQAAQMLERVGLGDRLDHHPGQLSGGQQQRVAVARALVNQPSILMGDEPTGNLDSRTSEEMIGLFAELNRRDRITVILVTHDPDVARAARRQIVLRDGVVVCDTSDAHEAFSALRRP